MAQLTLPFRSKIFRRVRLYITICLALLVLLFPIMWMILSAFKNDVDIVAYPPKFIFQPTLRNFQQVFVATELFNNTLNSLIVTVGSVVISLALGVPAAYAIARYKLDKVSMVILLVRMFPLITFLVPWFQMFQNMGLTDTYTALIGTHIMIALPLIVWITMGSFEEVPISLEEAALIDGCGQFGIFFKVALPLIKPGLVASSVLASIFCWNSLMFTLVLGGQRTKTLPVAIQNFMSFEQMQWGALSAIATLITLPIIIITLFLQKYLVSGLTGGGLKE